MCRFYGFEKSELRIGLKRRRWPLEVGASVVEFFRGPSRGATCSSSSSLNFAIRMMTEHFKVTGNKYAVTAFITQMGVADLIKPFSRPRQT